MKNPPFHRPIRLENIYRDEITKLLRFVEIPEDITLEEARAELSRMSRLNMFFSETANELSKRMINKILVTNAVSWKEAARKSSNGRTIYQMLRQEMNSSVGMRARQLVDEHATLIKTLPKNLAGEVSQFIRRQQMQGFRTSEIVKQLNPKLNDLKKYQIERLSRTGIANADTSITRARAEDIGFNCYQWLTSEDARVRVSHKHMDLVVIFWNNAPSPEALIKIKSHGNYHAGNDYNCRCIAAPVTSLKELIFPVKVYLDHSIKRVGLKQFALLSGIAA